MTTDSKASSAHSLSLGPGTIADVDALSATKRVELVDGILYELPVTTFEHGHIASVIVMSVGPAYQLGRGGPGDWWIQGENDFVADGQVLRPDAIGWLRSRLPSPTPSARVSIAPDWVLEVLSPSNRKHDLVTKTEVYARLGVRWRWYVDPAEREMRSYELVDGQWVELSVFCDADDAAVRVAPFETVDIPIRDFWAPREGGR